MRVLNVDAEKKQIALTMKSENANEEGGRSGPSERRQVSKTPVWLWEGVVANDGFSLSQ